MTLDAIVLCPLQVKYEAWMRAAEMIRSDPRATTGIFWWTPYTRGKMSNGVVIRSGYEVRTSA